MTKLIWIGFAFFIIAAGSSSTSKITSTWKAKNVQSKNYNKILVLGFMNAADRTIREKWKSIWQRI